jgi:hypothetical protein
MILRDVSRYLWEMGFIKYPKIMLKHWIRPKLLLSKVENMHYNMDETGYEGSCDREHTQAVKMNRYHQFNSNQTAIAFVGMLLVEKLIPETE